MAAKPCGRELAMGGIDDKEFDDPSLEGTQMRNDTGIPPARYSTVAIVLHWLIGALLIFEIGLGHNMEEAEGPAKFAVFQLHKSIGITILLLAVLRLLWRFMRSPPAVSAKGWEKTLAHGVHGLFYVLLFALPITGWVAISTGRIVVPTMLFGTVPWPDAPGFSGMAAAAKEGWHEAAQFVHVNLANLVLVLFALHVLGALKHHFIDRDADIARMAPGTRAGSWTDPRLWLIGLGVVGAAALGLTWKPAAPSATPIVAPVDTVDAAPAAPMPTNATAAEAVSAPAGNASEVVKAKESAPALQEPASWTIGKGSSLRFRTSWSGTPIEGGFGQFEGTIRFSPDRLDASHVEIGIHTASVFSGDAQRDETLKSADWFDTGSYSLATFTADRFRKTGPGRYVATGTLGIKGVTLPLSLPFTLDIQGDRARMRGTATVDRTAYGIGKGMFEATSEIPAAVSIEVAVNATRAQN